MPGGLDEFDEFEEFCAELTLDSGARLLLEPFQRELLVGYFAGTRETLILLPKKNGKTTLLGALALFHLLVTADAECVVAAASRDQATILYDQAVGFVRRSQSLGRHVLIKRGTRELRSAVDAGRIRVLAADVDTADGVIPTLALVDELHRHRSADLYGVFRDGLPARRGRMITISTAGDHDQTPLGLMRQQARRLPYQHRDGLHLEARSQDGAFVMHEWALDPEDDSDDMGTVKLANPASWQTLGLLAERHDSPSMLPWQWKRFACGLWVGAENWWLTGEEWRQLESGERLETGDEITVGFDGARYGDATALVGCRVRDGLLELLGCWEAPEGAGDWEVDPLAVDLTVASVMERFRVRRGYFDPPLWQTQIDEWAREYGEPAVMRYPTARARMMLANDRFRTDLAGGQVLHVPDERLDRHMLNAQVRETRGGYWLTKSRPGSPDKIDAAVAAVLAYEARADALQAEPVREPGRLLTF